MAKFAVPITLLLALLGSVASQITYAPGPSPSSPNAIPDILSSPTYPPNSSPPTNPPSPSPLSSTTPTNPPLNLPTFSPVYPPSPSPLNPTPPAYPPNASPSPSTYPPSTSLAPTANPPSPNLPTTSPSPNYAPNTNPSSNSPSHPPSASPPTYASPSPSPIPTIANPPIYTAPSPSSTSYDSPSMSPIPIIPPSHPPSANPPMYPSPSPSPSILNPSYRTSPSPSPSSSISSPPTYPPSLSPSSSILSPPTYPPSASPSSSISSPPTYPLSPSPSILSPSYPTSPSSSPSSVISSPPTYPPSPSPSSSILSPPTYPPSASPSSSISSPPTYPLSPSPSSSISSPPTYPPSPSPSSSISNPPNYPPSPSPSSSISSPPNYPPSPSPAPSGLTVGYYSYSCPDAENIVREAVKNATDSNRGTGAGLIRLFFHDCFVEGCDASVLLNTTGSTQPTERAAGPNLSLRGFEVIDAAKAALEDACPGVVSCADIVAFAGRDATFFLSGNTVDFDMPAGRYDGRVSVDTAAFANLPPPFASLQQLKDMFIIKGLDTEDMVTLSGAHTVGRSQCSSFSDRLPPNASDMNATLATSLSSQCNGTGDRTVPQDYVTPSDLDSQYYRNVLNHEVLFGSDAALLASNQTAGMVRDNAFTPGLWEEKFKAAMVKMGRAGVKTSSDGEIRKKCWMVNQVSG